MGYSIGVVTYVKRFESYFKPLIKQIKSLRPSIEIIVCVNGEINKPFDQTYRKDILNFISEYDNIYPCFQTEFRSLSKLWNTCLLNSSNDVVLLLNDDVTITSDVFFNTLENFIDGSSFKINNSWSHTVLNRKHVNEVGWFDERLLLIGDEDGDMEWRWGSHFNSSFNSKSIPNIINHVESEDWCEGSKKLSKKATEFNTNFMKTKYESSPDGEEYGIFTGKYKCINPTPNLYPCESFFWENKDKI